MDTAIQRVIKLIGSQKRLAIVTGVTEQAVSKWKKTGVIPIERCSAIVSAIDGQMSIMDLRPDIFTFTPAKAVAEVKGFDGEEG